MILTGVVGGVEALSVVRVVGSELDVHHVTMALYRLRQLSSAQFLDKRSHCTVVPHLKNKYIKVHLH